ncbi:hypothetical protein GQ472_01890 [archaeon]|nr:hypothetical protein [archaeon]
MAHDRSELYILMIVIVIVPIATLYVNHETAQRYASLTADHEATLDRLAVIGQDLEHMTELHEIERDIKVREIETLSGDLKEVTHENFNLKRELRDNEIQFYETYDLKTSPTYADVIEFIDADDTDRLSYVLHDHDCTQFSNTVIRNALTSGLFACAVDISLDSDADGIVDMGHAIVAFNTVDRGIIYIEPQDDRVLDMHIGMIINRLQVLQYDSCFEMRHMGHFMGH